MAKTKYGKYLSREIIDQSKYPQITAPMVKYRGDRGGKDLTFEWSCITKPFIMNDEPEVSDSDHFLLFTGSNQEDMKEFQAEIEIPLGKEKVRQIIKEPAFVYIPKGIVHGPVNFKNIKKPIAFWDISLDSKYSENWVAPDYSKYVAKPAMGAVDLGVALAGSPPDIIINHPDGTPFRYIRTPDVQGITCFAKVIGIQANICLGAAVVKYPSYCSIEPVHYHRKLDEWIVYLGGNCLDVEDFDAEIEMYWGKERERQLIDTACVCHIPPGLIHLGNEHRRVGKPFTEVIMVAGTGDYFSQTDKVLLSREERGEVMIAEGANDWVPISRE